MRQGCAVRKPSLLTLFWASNDGGGRKSVHVCGWPADTGDLCSRVNGVLGGCLERTV